MATTAPMPAAIVTPAVTYDPYVWQSLETWPRVSYVALREASSGDAVIFVVVYAGTGVANL